MNNGATKPIAVASAIGKYVRPIKRLDIEQTKKAGRIIWSNSRSVVRSLDSFFFLKRKKTHNDRFMPTK